MNLPMNNTPTKMKLLILLCMAALPATSVRAADNAENPAAKRCGVEAIASGRCEQRLADTDLNLAFRQYERVQMEAFEAKLKLRSLDTVPDLADAERAKQAQLLERRISNLGHLANELRERIMILGAHAPTDPHPDIPPKMVHPNESEAKVAEYRKLDKTQLQDELRRLQKELIVAESTARHADEQMAEAANAYNSAAEDRQPDLVLGMLEAEAKCTKPMKTFERLRKELDAAKQAYVKLLLAE